MNHRSGTIEAEERVWAYKQLFFFFVVIRFYFLVTRQFGSMNKPQVFTFLISVNVTVVLDFAHLSR